MKRRIVISLVIIAVLAGIGLSLYFFVFKDKNMTNQQASGLITRMAISAGVIEESENAPKIKDLVGSGSANKVINSNKLPSLSKLDLNWIDLISDSTEIGVKSLISGLVEFMEKDKIEQEKIYGYVLSEEVFCKLSYKIIGEEIIFIINVVEGEKINTAYVSIFYDIKDEEFEMSIVSRILDKGLNFMRTKIGKAGIKSIEKYNLTVNTDDLEKSIKNKEGNTQVRIMDFIKNKMQINSFSTSTDKNEILSKYIYQAYKNFSKKMNSNVEKMKKETNLIFFETPIYSEFFK